MTISGMAAKREATGRGAARQRGTIASLKTVARESRLVRLPRQFDTVIVDSLA